MASAGKFPIVRGSKTLDSFFDRLMAQPKPASPFNLRLWLRSSGLKSSYFDDMHGFAEFLGLVDSNGATDLWSELRSSEAHREKLEEALQEVYQQPLEQFGVRVPSEADRDRLVNWIRTVENADVTTAAAAVDTMLRAFDRALGRPTTSADQPERKRSVTQSAAHGSRASRPAAPHSATRRQAQSAAPRNRVAAPLPQIAVQVNLSPGMSAEEIDNVFASMARHIYAGRE